MIESVDGLSKIHMPQLEQLTISTKVNIEIIDLTGKTVFQQEFAIVNQRTEIPISLSSGIYILDINEKTGAKLREKLIVK